jgi:uncharacterized protein YdeI (BOF family)
MDRVALAFAALAGASLAMPLGADQPDQAGARGIDSRSTLARPTRVAEVKRGEQVRLEGVVVRVVDRDEFRLSDGTGSIPVRLPWDGPSPVEVGDDVRVVGVVDDDMTFGLARPEVYATSIELPGGATMSFQMDMAPVQPAESSRVAEPPSDRTPIASLARGQSATIAGRVVRILDSDEFRLEDESGSVRVFIGERRRMTVQVGDQVVVAGTLDDDPWPIRPEFYADSVMLAEGPATEGHENRVAGSSGSERRADDSLAPTARPEARTLVHDLRPYEVVLIEGVVDRITDEDEFRLRDASGSVRVYIGWRNRMPVARGERVSVVGIVDGLGIGRLFREVYAYQITTSDGRVIELQENRRSASSASSVESSPAPKPAPALDGGEGPSITPIAAVRRGQTVAVRGTVARIRDTDEFVLRDDSGSIRVYIGWRNRMPVSTGDDVTVFGTADDDVFPGFRPEIYADRIVLPDGRRIALERGGYRD